MNNALHSNIRTFAAAVLAVALVSAGIAFAFQASAQTVTGNVTGTLSATTTSADIIALQARIADLESRIMSLQTELSMVKSDLLSLIDETGGMNGGDNGTSTATTTGSAMVGPEDATVRAGASIDFGGSGFWYDEPITIRDGSGMVIGTARADGGGNWSTGSMSVPSSTGTYTYTFRGDWSGMTDMVTFTVTP